jgi:hypothetical protein
MMMIMSKKIVQTSLSVRETENTITLGSTAWDANFRDRLSYDRSKVLDQAINAWRSNPIARRIIELTTEFVIGDGFGFQVSNARVQKFLSEFWNHPLNNLNEQLPEWADEAWRTGDLFILFSVDEGGMIYVRALPSETISVITTAENDYRQELLYKRDEMDEHPWPSFIPPFFVSENGGTKGGRGGAVLHFPLNRAIGANFGESDLAPVLYWIGLYRQWLEDRARLNYFRQLFSFVLTRPFTSQAEKIAYMRDFAARLPKQSGGVLGLDPNESLTTLFPNLAAFEAGEDGLALKRMIAAGVGIPLHYLAEPEEANRTTAEAAGTPTFKRFKSRQNYLKNVLLCVLQAALAVRRQYVANMPAAADLVVIVPDITERDNATLALAVQRFVTAFAPIYNARLVDEKEFIRLVYRFLAETPPEKIGEFAPVNIRGGGAKLPNVDPLDPPKEKD